MTGRADRRLLYGAAFLRALATGCLGVLLGIYLPALGCDVAHTGWIIALGLAGVAISALLAMLTADRMGRRRFLVVLTGVRSPLQRGARTISYSRGTQPQQALSIPFQQESCTRTS